MNGRVTMAKSSDQDSNNEDLYFGLWKCLKIYRDEISAGPIEEAADDFKMKAAKEEGTMISMKNHEDFKDLMKEDKDFGDTTQIANRGSAACGRDRRPHQRRSQSK